MPRFAIPGATGLIGSLVTAAAHEQGHTTVPLSRSGGVDLVTGKGLDEALSPSNSGPIDAIIDCSDVGNGSKYVERIVPACQTLLAAAHKAGIKRYVMLSISGVEKKELQSYPFYKARYEQEREVLKDGGIEGIVVRSGQWFEFALNSSGAKQTEVDDSTSAGGKKQVVQVQDWAMQPSSAASIAAFLVKTAAAESLPEKIIEVAGPEKMNLPDMTKRYLQAKGDTREVVTVDAALPALKEGSLYPPEGADIVGPKLEVWLKELSS